MTSTGTYSELMYKIFSELWVASRFFIRGRYYTSHEICSEHPLLVIEAVNGCTSSKAFGDHIRQAGNELINRAMAVEATLRPSEKVAFLREVSDNFTLLIASSLKVQTKQINEVRLNEVPERRWLFDLFVTNIGHPEPLPPSLEEEIRIESWPYAQAWRKAIKGTRKQIRLLASLVNYLPVQAEFIERSQKESLIIIRSNVPQLAALMRIFFENESFGISNKKELCNNICKGFTTVNREILSPVSFKNKFDCPEAESIEFWIREFNGLETVARTLHKRYLRR